MRDILFVAGVSAWVLGIVTIAAGVQPLNDVMAGGAVTWTFQGLENEPANPSFRASSPFTPVRPVPLAAALLGDPPAATTKVTQVIADRPPRFQGDGVGHRDAMLVDGGGARFLAENSRLQNRRGWPDPHAVERVVAARFYEHPPAPTPSSAWRQ